MLTEDKKQWNIVQCKVGKQTIQSFNKIAVIVIIIVLDFVFMMFVLEQIYNNIICYI